MSVEKSKVAEHRARTFFRSLEDKVAELEKMVNGKVLAGILEGTGFSQSEVAQLRSVFAKFEEEVSEVERAVISSFEN